MFGKNRYLIPTFLLRKTQNGFNEPRIFVFLTFEKEHRCTGLFVPFMTNVAIFNSHFQQNFVFLIVGRHRGERAELAPEHHSRWRLLLRHAQDPAAAQARWKLGHLSTGNTTGSMIFVRNF